MRHPKSNKTGSSGNLAVMKKFVDIGWNPIPVPQEHDVGTDLLIIVSDNRLFDMGIVTGAIRVNQYFDACFGSSRFKCRKTQMCPNSDGFP